MDRHMDPGSDEEYDYEYHDTETEVDIYPAPSTLQY
jgi:hypothetical protein